VDKKKKYKKKENLKKNTSSKKVLPVSENDKLQDGNDEIQTGKSNYSFWRVFFMSLITIIFFSSSIVFFLNNKSQKDILFDQSKKYILDKLKKEGPSVEIYKALAELYKEKSPEEYYTYLKQAYNLLKPNQLYENRDLVVKLLEASYQRNEKIDNILHYLIVLLQITKPSNPEFFQIIASIVEIYNNMGNFSLAENILHNLEQIYSNNIQLKYLLANQYYISGKYQIAKEKIDFIIDYKKKNKQPFSIDDVTTYYLIYSKILPFDILVDRVIPLSLGLNHIDLNNFLLFLIDRPEITFEAYKIIISKIYVYRPEVKVLINQNPYINLEIGRKFWNKSNKVIAEIYFANALNTKDPEMKKIIQSYIDQIKKSKEATTKVDTKLDTKKIIEDVK